jgi:hypothetical protein
MNNGVKRKLIAKTLMASMTIFYTAVSATVCIGSGYLGITIAGSYDISQWWFIAPIIVVAIALLAYLETMGWYEKYYQSPRKNLEEWADL